MGAKITFPFKFLKAIKQFSSKLNGVSLFSKNQHDLENL